MMPKALSHYQRKAQTCVRTLNDKTSSLRGVVYIRVLLYLEIIEVMLLYLLVSRLRRKNGVRVIIAI